MIAKFGNLAQPKHSEDPEKPEAKEKVAEMMQKLHDAGFVREENIEKHENQQPDVKSYHVYSLPHQIDFSSSAEEAVKIMEPYSEYMKPLLVVG